MPTIPPHREEKYGKLQDGRGKTPSFKEEMRAPFLSKKNNLKPIEEKFP
jgi:hypothetical protein